MSVTPHPGHGDRDETATEQRDESKIREGMEKDPRRQIIQEIRKIQPLSGKHFKDIEIPEGLFQQARIIAWHEEGDRRFKKVPVYDLLVQHIRHKGGGDCQTLTKSQSVLDGWKAASIALFRYALNLQLAPKRPEFKKMKLSTSFYVYNISRYLYQAERVLHVMGYKPTDKKEGQDLVYEGEVNLVTVLETATDLLVMHEEICLLQDMVQRLISEKRDAGLEVLVSLREKSKSYEEAWATVMGSQTYVNLPLKAAMHEQYHAPNAHPSTSSPQVCSQPGNLVTPHQQSTHSPLYGNVQLSTGHPQQQHGVAGNQMVPMTQGIAPQQCGPHDSQMVGQYQTNFAPSHAASQGYYHPQPNVNQFRATTDVSQPRQQVAVSQYQDPRPAVSQYQSDPRPAVSQYQDPRPAVSQYQSDTRPAVSQYQSDPRPAVSQYQDPRPAVSQYQSDPRPAVSQYQDPRPAVSQYQSDQYQYQPGPGIAGQAWYGNQASNPSTHHQPQTEDKGVTHQTRDHLSHSEIMDPSKVNVHRQRMESHNMSASTSQDDQQSPNESINPDNLPAPIMNFFSHVGSTTPVTPYSERLESGPIMSGIAGARDGLSVLPSSESGPLGMQISESGEHSPNLTYDHSLSNSYGDHSPNSYGDHSPNVTHDHSFNKSSSSESVDIYSSGPTKPAYKYQRSSSSSVHVPPPLEETRIEGSWVVIGKDDQDDVPSAPSTPKSHQPALVTQGSQDKEPRALDHEVRPIPKPRRLQDKTQSVDIVEDQKRNKVQPVMRSCKSGSNLLDSQRNPDQSTSTTLEKPTPRPRSRSPSPAASSNENSPTASPTPPHRNIQQLPTGHPGQRSSHEMCPNGPPKHLKASTLPRQTQSFDTESEDKQKKSHFSSGSNIRDGERFRLPLKSSTAQNTIEPDTPVKGIIPLALRKVQNASNTDQVPSSRLTSHGHGKESMSPISQSPVSSPTQLQPTDSHPLSDRQPQTDDTSTPDVPSSQSSAPYSLSEEPPVPQPVRDTSHPISSPAKETKPSVFPAPATKSSPVVGTTPAKAESVITSKPDESRLDRGGESAQALRKTIDQGRNPEKPTMRDRANAHSGQRPDNVSKKELATEDPVKDRITDKKGLDDSTTELEQKYGISLTGTWTCPYCTNLVQESDLRCDVCSHHRHETLV